MKTWCEWFERYPIESCLTRVQNEFGDRMDKSRFFLNQDNRKKEKKRILTEEQKNHANMIRRNKKHYNNCKSKFI